MRRIRHGLLILLLCLSTPALAEDGGETTRNTDGTLTDTKTGEDVTEGGQCDYEGFKQSIKDTESCGGSYKVVNSLGYSGAYQFGEGALAQIGWYQENGKSSVNGDNNFEGSWTGKAFGNLSTATPTSRRGGGCKNPSGGGGKLVSPVLQAFLDNPAAQDAAFHEWMTYLNKATKGCQSYIGSTVTGRNLKAKGKPAGECKVTMSGILAGAHLCGQGGVCKALRSGKAASDANKTSCFDYICTHGGFKTPWDGDGSAAGQCTPGGDVGTDTGPGSLSEADDDEKKNTDESHYKIVGDLVDHIWIGGLQLMAEQMTVTMMNQVEIIGSFFDAKHQLETQRLLQQKAAQAHKDYHPSEQMCTIGTFSRALADTDRRQEFSHMALTRRGLQRETASGDSLGVEGNVSDRRSRFDTFRKNFCNKHDNADGLGNVCEKNVKPEMVNRDIDFTRTVDLPLTLDFDPVETTASDEETAVYALMDNLFQNDPPILVPNQATLLESFVVPYQNQRAIIAMRSVARNSMGQILAQKSLGPETDAANTAYLYALVKEMGITDEKEITAMLGERPSYWAQMEILTKKLYQNPNFIVNLYDKPANVARTRAALRAIKTMQDRDIQEALARREMLVSLLAEISIRRQQQRIDTQIQRLNLSGQAKAN